MLIISLIFLFIGLVISLKKKHMLPIVYTFLSMFFFMSDFKISLFSLELSFSKIFLVLALASISVSLLNKKDSFTSLLEDIRKYSKYILAYCILGVLIASSHKIIHGYWPTFFIKSWIYSLWGCIAIFFPINSKITKELKYCLSLCFALSFIMLAPQSFYYFFMRLSSLSRTFVGGLDIRLAEKLSIIPLTFTPDNLKVTKGWFFIDSPSTHTIMLLFAGFLSCLTMRLFETKRKRIELGIGTLLLLSFLLLYVNEFFSTMLIFIVSILIVIIVYTVMNRSFKRNRNKIIKLSIFLALVTTWTYVNPLSSTSNVNLFLNRFSITWLSRLKKNTDIIYDDYFAKHSYNEGNRISLAASTLAQLNGKLLTGVSFPKNGQFEHELNKKNIVYSGHCFQVDWFTSFGAIFGTLSVILFWGPIITITKMFFSPKKTLRVFSVHEYCFWALYFSVSFLVSFGGIYGFNPNHLAIQMAMMILFYKTIEYQKSKIEDTVGVLEPELPKNTISAY